VVPEDPWFVTPVRKCLQVANAVLHDGSHAYIWFELNPDQEQRLAGRYPSSDFAPCGDDDDVMALVQQTMEFHLTLLVDDLIFTSDNQFALVGQSNLEAVVAAVTSRSFDDPTVPALTDIPLPWIQDLAIPELLLLRERASRSLPRLRQLLGQLNASGKGATSIANELLAQVPEIEAELSLAQRVGDGKYRTALESLAVSLVIFGVSTGNAVLIGSSIAALVASLVYLQNLSRERTQKLDTVSLKPAFALLEAKQLIKYRTA
jgi:hypothetical protein